MPVSALLPVLVAAFCHAAWNLLAKRASASKHLMWFASFGEAILLLPVAALVFTDSRALSSKAVAFLIATGVLHLLYFEALQRSYRSGDLSVVYPLARGSGPMLSFIGAVVWLGERPSPVAISGVVLVGAGVMTLSGGLRRMQRAALGWGLATGACIAGYTLVDAYSVKILMLSPILVEYAECLFRTVALSGPAWRDRAQLRTEARRDWPTAAGIAVLLPAAYILVLLAMRSAQVSQVAPIREISMLLAAWFGTRLLNEGRTLQRLAGSALIAGGVTALALG